jgi:hypothetical protein
MMVYLILASAAFMGGAFAAGLLVVILGIRRGDHGKRLTGRPASNSEAFARRLLTGSRGYGSPSNTGGGPVSRITDVSAVAISARHCTESDCMKCRARSRWMRRKSWRSRKSVNRRMRGRKR